MQRLPVVSVFLGVVFVLTINSIHGNVEELRSAALTRSINRLSWDLYQKIAANNANENLIMSSFSAQVIMSLLTMAAKNETLEEMNRALYLPDVEFTKAAFKPFLKKLKDTKGITLDIANKIYVKDGADFELSPEFQSLAVDAFSSEIQNIDFTKSQEAANDINSWVEQHTRNKIKNFLSPDLLNDLTRMVLINAIYFKGDWNLKFNPARTQKRDFHLNRRNRKEVEMMNIFERFSYAVIPEFDARMVELNYANLEASMIIILPNEIGGLGRLEQRMTVDNFTDYLFRLEDKSIDLSLPRFSINSELDLISALRKIGIKKIFSNDESDLSGLLKNQEKLHISDAFQKGFIEVNEEGSEVGIATGFVPLIVGGFPRFNADHPFMFKILTKNREILFSGRYVK